ncbi:RING finger protein 44-like [Impatiens glandulifera]|uniref:RING finger protein 44-like n=1 Tax=Impatiens glandulifera TaxID=253017 RepID=UPI001FB0BBC2|nr:RING finger protein 44-like [Impatiens glandulifera]XP_047306252.1 RING finger protein 44-like [Impatiens glandulifera]
MDQWIDFFMTRLVDNVSIIDDTTIQSTNHYEYGYDFQYSFNMNHDLHLQYSAIDSSSAMWHYHEQLDFFDYYNYFRHQKLMPGYQEHSSYGYYPNVHNHHPMRHTSSVAYQTGLELTDNTPPTQNNYLPYHITDEVVVLDISEMINNHFVVDRQSDIDMYLDIDNISYEELLLLGEQIGRHVETGISEESINLRTRDHLIPETQASFSSNQGGTNDFCVICQEEYMMKEKIGGLDCGHEFHVDCIKRWILINNICPICKSPGIPIAEER